MPIGMADIVSNYRNKKTEQTIVLIAPMPDPDPERYPPGPLNPHPLPDPGDPGPDVLDPGIPPEPLPA